MALHNRRIRLVNQKKVIMILEFLKRLWNTESEYKDKVISNLTQEFGYKNVMQVPKLTKIVISKGVGAAVADKKLIDHAVEEITTIFTRSPPACMSLLRSLVLSETV